MNISPATLPALEPLTVRIGYKDYFGAPDTAFQRYVDVRPDVTQLGGRENDGRAPRQFASLADAVEAAKRVSNPTGDNTNLRPYAIVEIAGPQAGASYFTIAPAAVVRSGSVLKSDLANAPFEHDWHGVTGQAPEDDDTVQNALQVGAPQAIVSRPAQRANDWVEIWGLAVGDDVSLLNGDKPWCEMR